MAVQAAAKVTNRNRKNLKNFLKINVKRFKKICLSWVSLCLDNSKLNRPHNQKNSNLSYEYINDDEFAYIKSNKLLNPVFVFKVYASKNLKSKQSTT